MLQVLKHNNIVSFLGTAKFQSNNQLLIMELCVPDLKALLCCPNRKLTEDEVGVLMGQILGATAFMHNLGIVHRYNNNDQLLKSACFCKNCFLFFRDLKPSNILFKVMNNQSPQWETFDIIKTPIKVGDFGLSRFLPREGDRSMSKNVGTMRYQAPEVKGGSNYGKSADIYPIGLMAFEMMMNMPVASVDNLPSKKRKTVFFQIKECMLCSV